MVNLAATIFSLLLVFILLAITLKRGTSWFVRLLSAIGLGVVVICVWPLFRYNFKTGETISSRTIDSIPSAAWIDSRTLAVYDFEKPTDRQDPSVVADAACTGNYGMVLNVKNQFSRGLSNPIGQLRTGDSCWLRVSGYFRYDCRNTDARLYLVISCNRNGKPYKYRMTDLTTEKFCSGQWNRVIMSYLLPSGVDPNDLVQAYFLSYSESDCRIDDIEIALFKPNYRL